MEEAKNIFDYAPKELTQDGFLRWLFESYEDPEIKDLARDFLLFLTNKEIDIGVPAFKGLRTRSQLRHMDVWVDFFYEGDGEIASKCLVIEDKTYSGQHGDQLERYNEIIDRWDSEQGKGRKTLKAYYKTSPMSEWERENVKASGWEAIPLAEIDDFWKERFDHKNLIVSSYAKHIHRIRVSSECDSKPSDNDIVAWLSFFEKKVKKPVEERISGCSVNYDETRYAYAYLNVYPKECDRDKTPYLEIRSRDLLGGGFVARILKYGKDIDEARFSALRECISDGGESVFRPYWGTQEAATTKKIDSLSSASVGALIESLVLCAKEYLEIIRIWNGQK